MKTVAPKLAQGKRRVRVEIRLDRLSQPIVFSHAHSTYQKGDLFCVFVKSNEGEVRNQGVTYKYPIASIFNVKETY